MFILFAVSVAWAFSFGLSQSVSQLDPNLVASIRLGLSLPLFIFFFKRKHLPKAVIKELLWVGMVQYGLFYCLYGWSFRFIPSHQVALFTVFMPLYVTLLNDVYRRAFRKQNLVGAGLAALGAGIILFEHGWILNWKLAFGFLIMQAASLAYSYGQIEYKRIRLTHPHLKDTAIFALVYAGGLPVCLLGMTLSGGWHDITRISAQDIMPLLYLGLIASGLCFYAWNKMTTHVSGGTLAVWNNAKIPMAIAISLLLFDEQVISWGRLLTGCGLIAVAAFLVEQKREQHTTAQAAHS